MVTTYKHMKYPEPVTLVDPETQTVRTGIAAHSRFRGRLVWPGGG